MKESFVTLCFDVVAHSSQEFAAYIKADVEKWCKVIKEAKIPLFP